MKKKREKEKKRKKEKKKEREKEGKEKAEKRFSLLKSKRKKVILPDSFLDK